MNRTFLALILLLALSAIPACASRPTIYPQPGFSVEVLVDGGLVPQYVAYGIRYVEAVKGKEYSIRLRNPLGVRVAVALSVDGLNSIDARHTDARSASKWVLEPYETVTIGGWQTNMSQARRFYFTSEEQSYAQWLGKTDNIGIISAVYFRERVPSPPVPLMAPEAKSGAGSAGGGPSAAPRQDANKDSSRAAGESAAKAQAADEYAATGIGQRVDHRVQRVHLDLESSPVATVNVRYEYRQQLVRLGIFPPPPPNPDPLARRQNSRGFEPGFCPDPR